MPARRKLLTFDIRNLVRADPQVAKHARLLHDMTPLSRRAQPRQLLEQPAPHLEYPPAHRHQILGPLLLDLGRPQHRLGDARAVQRRGANGCTLRVLKDTLDGTRQRRRGRDEQDGTGALAVEAHGLGEGQTHGSLHAQVAVEEVAQGPGVLVDGARVEAEIGRVEDGEEALRADDVCDGAPLLARRVAAGRVVGAGVEDDGGVGLGGAQGGEVRVKVEGAGGVVVVRQPLDVEAHGLEEELVVGPGWRGDVDILDVGVGFLQGHACEQQGARAGERLDA